MTVELREALNEAFDKESVDDATIPTEVQSLAPTEEAAEVPPNDEAASNAARQEPQATPETGTPEVEKPHAPVKKAEVQAEGIHRVDRAPASWKKEAKSDWNTLPLAARQEIHRREMEVQRVLNETAPIRQEIQQFREAVTPYMARIQSLGVTPHQAVGELLKADYLLATGTASQKAQFIDKLLQDYDVDINELDSAIARRLGITGQPATQPNAPQFDPNQVTRLVQQQLQQALAPIYQQQQLQQQAQQTQIAETVEQMALDPKYPHFDAVRQDMADLMDFYASKREPIYLSLDEAYSRAISMRPDISAMQQATQMNQRAQRAANAAASISGAPVGGGTQAHASSGNLREDVEAAFGGARI